MTLTLLSIASLIWFVIGVIAARYVVPAVATATSTYNNLTIVQTIKWYGFRNTLTAYAQVYCWMLAMPVIARVRTATSQVKTAIAVAVATSTTYMKHAIATIQRAIAVATSTYNNAVAVAVATSAHNNAVLSAAIKHAVAIATSIIETVAADVARDMYAFVDVATSIIDGLVIAIASDMPDTSTSTYALTVSADVAQYNAGEYLVRDNGTWRNVYLTAHARALMGTSPDVIALSPATVYDASGSSQVWHLSIA